jgi:hypothetical protein
LNGIYLKGGKMKKLAIVFISFFIVIGVSSFARADFVQYDVSPVSFYVVDDNDDPGPDGDDQVALSIAANYLPTGYVLQWLDEGVWSDVSSSITIATGADDWEQVFLRLYNPDSGAVDNDADLTFFSPEGSNLWNGVTIAWDDAANWYSQFSILSCDTDDNVAPSAPIPGVLWLFVSGLFGVAGIRRFAKGRA